MFFPFAQSFGIHPLNRRFLFFAALTRSPLRVFLAPKAGFQRPSDCRAYVFRDTAYSRLRVQKSERTHWGGGTDPLTPDVLPCSRGCFSALSPMRPLDAKVLRFSAEPPARRSDSACLRCFGPSPVSNHVHNTLAAFLLATHVWNKRRSSPDNSEVLPSQEDRTLGARDLTVASPSI